MGATDPAGDVLTLLFYIAIGGAFVVIAGMFIHDAFLEYVENVQWDYWVGSDPVGDYDSAVVRVKTWFKRWGCHIDLHNITRGDEVGCFHSHPAWAFRIVLMGGYEEEVMDEKTGETYKQLWRPGNIGLVAPDFVHRIHRTLDGESYSLWLRWRITHGTRLVGIGWDGRVTSDELALHQENE